MGEIQYEHQIDVRAGLLQMYNIFKYCLLFIHSRRALGTIVICALKPNIITQSSIFYFHKLNGGLL